MRIESADDLETPLILLAVGLLVGEVGVAGPYARRDQERAAEAIARVHRVADAVAHGEPLARRCSTSVQPRADASCSASTTAGSSSRRSAG